MEHKSWHLFLDDERFPAKHKEHLYTIARSVDQAQKLCAKWGAPQSVSLDHDLGHQVPTGMDFCKWLVDQDLDHNGTFLPQQFCFVIHSANPVGERNMQGLLTPYLQFKRQGRTNDAPASDGYKAPKC